MATAESRLMASTSDLEAWLAAGQAALDAGQYADAAAAFTRVHEVVPGEITVALMVADAWRLAGRTGARRHALVAVFHHVPASPSGATSVDHADLIALHALGAALLDAGAPLEAQSLFERVVRQRPRDPAALGALAGATRAAGDPQRAWPIAQRAMAIAPRQPALLLTAAQIRHALGDLTRARYWLDRAEALRPAHGPTRLQRALTSLLGGPSAEGWADFEHRGLPTPPTTGAAPWRGGSLDGQSILVTMEQGHGDSFQFVRFVDDLVSLGADRVVVECPPSMRALFAASGFHVAGPGAVPGTDWYVPILSLPHWLGRGAEVTSRRVPYLHTGVPGAPRAAQRANASVRRIGVVWQGNPAFPATTLRDFDRALLPQLLEIPAVEWVSLQYGATDVTTSDRIAIPELSPIWLDTAVLLDGLDAVVSVDTGIAHLAGAMGIPTYVLLPFSPDWRWGLGTDSSPWYPSVRLIRQRAPRAWGSVVDDLARSLG
jgi:Glycosyltransferase family 9 (heptosyltransferase)